MMHAAHEDGLSSGPYVLPTELGLAALRPDLATWAPTDAGRAALRRAQAANYTDTRQIDWDAEQTDAEEDPC